MRLRLVAVAVLLVVFALQVVASPPGPQQYIVKTKHLIAQAHATAAPSVHDAVRAGGGHVDYEWRDRLVVTLPDAAVQTLMQNPAVEFVHKVTSGIPEGGSAAAENADPVVTSSAFRPVPKSSPPWMSGTYGYDGQGNITAIGSNAYSYDAFSRLVTSTTNGIPETYSYDRYGNLKLKVTGAGSTALTVQSEVDDGNHLSGHCYDTAGNLTDDAGVNCPTATETHSFDALNMMTMKWNRSASTKEYYIYNANDERIAVISCSGTVCTEQITFSFRDESGKVLRQFEVPYQQFDSPWTWVEDYVYRDGVLLAAERMPAQGGRRYFHTDHLGTPRLITDSNGHRTSEHDYFPFGVEATPLRQDTVPPNNFNREEPMKFTGHERDFTVGTSFQNSNYIDYMHARSTVPQWGRFLSVDPVLNLKVAMAQPQAWNRYSYVMNNPMRYTDPTGRESDPGELDGMRNKALDPSVRAYVEFVWSAVHAEDLRSAFTGFGSAPWTEKLMAGAVGVISVLDVASNFIEPEKSPISKTGAVMLGHFPEYLEAGAKANAKVFNIPKAIWNSMSDATRWTANQKFLDRAIARGATLLLATDPAKIKAGSYLAKEVSYLLSNGFRVVKETDGLWRFIPK
jgi:RHS repeat-associated protein